MSICFSTILYMCGTLCGNSFPVREHVLRVGVYQRPITACGLFMHYACNGYFHGMGDVDGVRGVCAWLIHSAYQPSLFL